ncbi:hypothetical protein I6E31_11100 [Fusobacterium varium]|nr:hypothetical protein [Fusobacterium varium]
MMLWERIVPIQGAFYCIVSKKKAFFNYFREDIKGNEEIPEFLQSFPYKEIDRDLERKILTDFNNQVSRLAPEYLTNLDVNTPTNRILTSMCSPERLLYLLKYDIAYVNFEKRLMVR